MHPEYVHPYTCDLDDPCTYTMIQLACARRPCAASMVRTSLLHHPLDALRSRLNGLMVGLSSATLACLTDQVGPPGVSCR